MFPAAVIVASELLLLLHVPPAGVLVTVAAEDRHTDDAPPIGVGTVLMVCIMVL
jgi:hypothetical protein